MRHTARRALSLLLVVAALAAGPGCSTDRLSEPAEAERVLIFTMPGVTWDEVQAADLPNLERFLDDAAIGAVSTRIGRTLATTTAAYLTLGAGTRAVVPGVDTGVALNPDELHGGIPASELLRRRLGYTVSGIAYIPVGATLETNADSLFEAEPGLLGDALDAAGVRRAVIANADAAEGFPSDQPPPDGAYARSAATAMMGTDGVVPGGSVGRDLLVEDPDAPFGRRLDHDAVRATFDEQWHQPGSTVVLVEASDLARATGYGLRARPEQARRLRAEALADADDLLGDLLDRTDPETDAVLVLAPVSRTSLGIVALRSPGGEPGLLRSASTRRDGYVYLADVAPTVLELVGLEAPTSIEGRSFDVAAASGDRIERLDEQVAAAGTRDDRLPVVVPAIIAGLALLALATRRRDQLPSWALRLLRPAAFTALGVVPATFLAGLVPGTWESELGYWAALAGISLACGAALTLVDRTWPGLGSVLGPALVLAVIGADVLAGAPLQVNAVFGYSMAVAGRFTGLGNLAFALLSSAAVCVAVMAYERWGRAALRGLAVLLLLVVLLDGLPMLGADVGGVISVVPAFCLALIALTGRRVTWRHAAGALGIAVLAVGLLGLLDRSQPAGSETHLARIGEHLVSGRIDSVATTLWRRVNASFGAEETLTWLIGIGLVAAAMVQAALLATGRVGSRSGAAERSPATRALLVGLGTLAVVGLVANDSSIAVPATMLIVVVPVLVLRDTGDLVARPPEVVA